MKVLFSVHPGLGHVHQAFRLGHALQEAGHEVAMATAKSYKSKIEHQGFQHFPAGLEWDMGKLEKTIPEIRLVPREAFSTWIMKNIFLERSARIMIPQLLQIAKTWSPNVMVVDNFEFGGVIAAEMLKLPCTRYHYSFYLSTFLFKNIQLSHPINQLRTLFNLPPGPECLGYQRCLELCFMMPNWNLPWLQESGEIPPSVHFIDPLGEHPETSSPGWLMQLPPQPTIYLSLGTVFNQIYPEIFDHTISALREEPFNLIISLGDKQADSGRFGLLPKSIRVESFIWLIPLT